MCLKYILVGLIFSIILPHTTLPILRTISTGFILPFSYTDTKHIHPYSSLPCAYSLPLVPTPVKDLLFPPALHFKKLSMY
jgi:hypothetical protein